MKSKWLLNKKLVVFLHIIFWLLLFSLPLFVQTYLHNDRPHQGQGPSRNGESTFYIIKSLWWVGLFYLNAYFLFPVYFNKKKYGKYLLLQLLSVGLIILIDILYFQFAPGPGKFNLGGFILFNTFPYLFMLACSIAYRMFVDRAKIEREARAKETEHLKTELSFLRSQISPHFIFNVLNNMVALARKKSDALEPSLIKLSSILRYMLYENDEEKVALQKEVEYLNSYIDLQQQRFGKNVQVNVSLNCADNNYFIEPMLLIPFVENAFKHGTGTIENAQIDIALTCNSKGLEFVVKNKFNGTTQEIKDKTSGIGLANVQRRLKLLYKEQHHLSIDKNDGWFKVSLKLNVH